MIIRSARIKQRCPKKSLSLPWKAVNVFVFSLCLVFGVMYLVGMNDLTVKGFVLKDLKSQANLLASENQDMQAQALTLQSYASLAPRLQNLNMVSVDDVAYFSQKSPVVARK